MTMAGGALAERFANRRTDYAMVGDDPADLANCPDHETPTSTGWTTVFARALSGPETGPLRDGHRP